jgi:tRNA pseudouridine55 synthase
MGAAGRSIEDGRVIMNGVLIIDKPLGLVSMRAVERVRRLSRVKRAGHAGTLDPAASGVLPVCLGKATRLASLLMGEDKEYLATVRLGLETDTYDLDGKVLRETEVPSLTEAELALILGRFRGTIRQRPPAYSAIRKDGERLYDKARRGEQVEAPEREVVIYELELRSMELPFLELRVRCGKGTYIRSLAMDLGAALGCGGCLSALRRTRVGALTLERAVTLEELAERAEAGSLAEVLLTPADALAHLEAIRVGEAGLTRLRQGQLLGPDDLLGELPDLVQGQLFRLLDEAGALVALAEPSEGRLQPRKVMV